VRATLFGSRCAAFFDCSVLIVVGLCRRLGISKALPGAEGAPKLPSSIAVDVMRDGEVI
jgi:hypothetical protein